jgi:hypothetical protein
MKACQGGRHQGGVLQTRPDADSAKPPRCQTVSAIRIDSPGSTHEGVRRLPCQQMSRQSADNHLSASTLTPPGRATGAEGGPRGRRMRVPTAPAPPVATGLRVERGSTPPRGGSPISDPADQGTFEGALPLTDATRAGHREHEESRPGSIVTADASSSGSKASATRSGSGWSTVAGSGSDRCPICLGHLSIGQEDRTPPPYRGCSSSPSNWRSARARKAATSGRVISD